MLGNLNLLCIEADFKFQYLCYVCVCVCVHYFFKNYFLCLVNLTPIKPHKDNLVNGSKQIIAI